MLDTLCGRSAFHRYRPLLAAVSEWLIACKFRTSYRLGAIVIELKNHCILQEHSFESYAYLFKINPTMLCSRHGATQTLCKSRRSFRTGSGETKTWNSWPSTVKGNLSKMLLLGLIRLRDRHAFGGGDGELWWFGMPFSQSLSGKIGFPAWWFDL